MRLTHALDLDAANSSKLNLRRMTYFTEASGNQLSAVSTPAKMAGQPDPAMYLEPLLKFDVAGAGRIAANAIEL